VRVPRCAPWRRETGEQCRISTSVAWQRLSGCPPPLQFVGAFGSLLGFYGVALPVAYVLAFPVSMGLPGIWIGMCTGYAVVSTVYLVVVRCMNWERACEIAWKAASQGMTPDARLGVDDNCSRVPASEDTLSLLHAIPETDETSSLYSELMGPLSDAASLDVEVKLE
jgi:hypothetical protein